MGDITQDEKFEDSSPEKIELQTKDDEISTSEPDKITSEGDNKEENKTETEEKHNKLKSDVFYIEVVDKKVVETSNDSAPPATPTSRRINKLRDHSSNIFPAGCMGCREEPPSDHITSPRRFLDPIEAKDRIGHIDSTPRKRPLSAKPRNPLTGAGLEEEVKKPLGRRKDGNPLLGEGYDMKDITPSCTRIPPGGYSQGLW